MTAFTAWASNRRLVGLTLLLVVVLAYTPGILGGAFHFDDVHHITDNPALHDSSNLFSLRYFVDPTLWSGEPGNVMYRPAGMLPHALDYFVWASLTGDGYYASGWVLTNALLHAGVALLVWRLALRLGLSEVAAALSGLVMALHPVHTEVVNYVSARSESTAAVLMLSALLVHFRARESEGRRRLALAVAAGALSILAVTAKETTALFFVGVFWLELVTSKGPWGARLRRGLAWGGVYLAFFGAVMLLRRSMLDHAVADLTLVTAREGVDPQIGGGRTVLQNLYTQSRVVIAYYQQLIRPVGLNIDHDIAVVTAPTPAVFVTALVHLAIAGAALRELGRGRRLVPLCAGWFWIFLAPSVIVPLNVVMNEHRLYLPGVAIALLAGASLARVAARLESARGPTFATAAVALPFVLFVPLVIQRSLEWRDDFTLWTAAVERSPESARAHLHLGAAWHEKANAARPGEAISFYDEALREYEIADRLHPRWYDLQLNLGGAYLARGRNGGSPSDLESALAAYVLAGEIVGLERERPRFLQAAVLTEMGRYDEAIAIIRALDEADDSVTTIYDDALARALRKKGDLDGAAAAMRRVIAIEEPDDRVDGMLTLGWWYFEDGDLEQSEALLTRALDIAKRTGAFRPYLYIARFLNLLRQDGAQSFAESAVKLGWSATPDEVLWVRGGPTPGARTGTR